MMYRPFLPYVSQGIETRNVDKRSYACAAACVSVARNIVHITGEMKRRGLLVGSHWFVMYTSYFSILSLVFFVFENPQSPAGKDIMRDATEGRNMLASLAKRSLAADRCSQSLTVSSTSVFLTAQTIDSRQGLFAELPVKLNERKNSSQSLPPSRKRPPQGNEAPQKGYQSLPNIPRTNGDEPQRTPSGVGPFPAQDVANAAQRKSMRTASGISSTTGNSPLPQQGQWKAGPSTSIGIPDSTSSASVRGQQRTASQVRTSQQLGTHLPDLRGLMFPSSNPFAYGNQPLSTLEDSQMMARGQQSDMPGPTTGFDLSASEVGQQADSFSAFSNPAFANPEPQFPYSQGAQASASMPGNNPPTYQVPPSMCGVSDIGNLNIDESFWQQMGKSGRTGLTPGVNLDELFGHDGGWNPMYIDQDYGRIQ
jgi:hypothetical protein